jgi:hypothetical protein
MNNGFIGKLSMKIPKNEDYPAYVFTSCGGETCELMERRSQHFHYGSLYGNNAKKP